MKTQTRISAFLDSALVLGLVLGLSACGGRTLTLGGGGEGGGGGTSMLMEFQEGDGGRNFDQDAVAQLNQVPPADAGQPLPQELSSTLGDEPFGLSGASGIFPLDASAFVVPPQPLLALSGVPAIRFEPLIVGQRGEVSLGLANLGAQALMLISLEMTPPSPDIRVVGTNCPSILPPLSQCELMLQFSPSQPGKRTHLLRITYLRPDGSRSVALRNLEAEALVPPPLTRVRCQSLELSSYEVKPGESFTATLQVTGDVGGVEIDGEALGSLERSREITVEEDREPGQYWLLADVFGLDGSHSSCSTRYTVKEPGAWYQANRKECSSFCNSLGLQSMLSPEGHACTSGELIPASAKPVINYAYGCWPNCGVHGAANGRSHGDKCYGSGQKRDGDRTDRTVGCFCG